MNTYLRKNLPSVAFAAFAATILLTPTLSSSQVTIKPEAPSADPRLAALRQKFQSGALKHRRLDTFVDVKIARKNKERETIERIVQGYLAEVGAEPISYRDSGSATFRLEISSNQSVVDKVIYQSLFMVLYDRTLSQGERPIMRSRTDLQCNELVYGRDYNTFAPPQSTCVREEAQLREAFLRLR